MFTYVYTRLKNKQKIWRTCIVLVIYFSSFKVRLRLEIVVFQNLAVNDVISWLD